eukprot:96302_1
MLQTIIFISSITYITLGNRLLQQWVAPKLPTDVPQQNTVNNPQFPSQNANPNANPNQQYIPPPLPPAAPQVLPYAHEPYVGAGHSQPWVVPYIPTELPQAPAYTPIYNPSAPYDPINNPYGIKPNNNPYAPVTTPFPQGMSDLLCETVGSCANKQLTIFNPVNAFRLVCEVAGSCSGATLTVSLNMMSSGVEFFEGIYCKEGRRGANIAGACEGSRFILDNTQLGGHSIEIEKLECSGDGSCNNMEIIIGPNAKILGIFCDYNQCDGCVLKVNPWDRGTPCLTPGLVGDPFPL